MNSTPHLDLHPDAESLNAFVEQALGAAERAQVLSHLAGCGRCRQVVFLVQAAAEEETPARVATSRAARESWRWIADWRWIWVPVAALAAVVVLAVTFNLWTGGLRPKRAAAAPEIAKVMPQSPMQAPAPVLPEHKNAETTQAVVPPAALKLPAKRASSFAERAPAASTGQFPAASSGGPLLAGSFHGEGYAPLSAASASGAGAAEGPVPGGQANTVLFKPQPGPSLWPQQTLQKQAMDAPAKNAGGTQLAQTSLRAMGGSQTVRALSFAAAMPRSEAQPAAGNSLAVSMKRTLTAAPALAGIGGFKLPGGVRAVSAAVTLDRTLAVDPTGALFLSEDAGLHWEPITQQWTGRVLEVRATKPASDPAAPALGFELMNEAGLTWTSMDGKVWKAK